MTPRELKLQVILSAVDKLTKPLKNWAAGSSSASKEVKALRDRVKELNAQSGKIDSFRNISAQAAIVGNNLKIAQEKAQRLGAEFKALENPTKKQTNEFEAAKRAVNDLHRQHSELINKQQRLRDVLEQSGVKTSALSRHQRELKASLAQTTTELTAQEAKLKAHNAMLQKQAANRANYDKAMAARNKFAGSGATLTVAGVATGAPIVMAIKQYSSFEDAMLGVARQVDGARDDNGKLTRTYYDMANEIKRLSRTIPLATTEIAAIVEAGARMGIKGKENLIAFAKATAMTASAFDLPVDQVGEQMGKLSNLYKIPIKSISELGDVINYLDDNALAKGGDIIDVMQRIAGTAATVKMGFKDAAALGSTFLSLGSSAEIAATASNAMMRELAIAAQQPKRFQAGLSALKLNAKEIQSSMSKDATGTILRVMEAINKLPQEKQLGVTTQLFGKEYGDDAAKLANNLGEYRRQLALVNNEKSRGSMGRESDARNDVLSSRLQMLKNRVFNQMSDLGETMRPALVSLMTSFSGVLDRMNAWTKANPELTAALVKIAAVVAIVVTAIGGLLLMLAAVLGPLAMVKFALVSLGVGLPLITSLISGGATAFNLLMRAVGMAGNVILWLGRALLMNPIGLAVTAIAAAAFLIYKYWEPIRNFFTGLWKTITDKSSAAADWVSGAWSAASGRVSQAWSLVKPYFDSLWGEIQTAFKGGILGIAALIVNWSPLGMFYRAFATVLSWFGIDLPKTFTGFGGMIMDGLINGVTAALGRVKAAITGAGESTINWFKEKLGIHSPSRVFAQLGGHTMAGYNQGLQNTQNGPLATVLNFGKKITAAAGTSLVLASPAFADGSGTALSTPTFTSGTSLQRPHAQQNIASSDTYEIHIHAAPGMDATDLAREVEKILDRRDQQRAARSRAQLTEKD